MKNTLRSTSQMSEMIEDKKTPILIAPFAGASIAVKCKRLTTAQKMVCGNFFVVETVEDKINSDMRGRISLKELDEYSNYHYEILRSVLVYPSYEFLIQQCSKDLNTQENLKELDKMLKDISQLPTTNEKKELTDKILKMKIKSHYVLPDDFVQEILKFALGKDTIIEGLTNKMFVEAAILAEKGNDNPVDHIDPECDFLPLIREDINRRAIYLLAQERDSGS